MTALDWFIRGATFGLCVVLATRLLHHDRRTTARLGALFVTGVACYVLVSAPDAEQLPKTLIWVVHGVAIFNAVFFWWFATSLFDYVPRWQIQPWLPALILLMTIPFRAWQSSTIEAPWVGWIHQIVVVALLLHVAYLAIHDFNSDLVAARRRFRWAVATLIPLMAITIVMVESGLFGITISNELLLLQAVALLLLVAGFAYWILHPREDLFDANAQVSDASKRHYFRNVNTYSAEEQVDAKHANKHLERKNSTSSIDSQEVARLLGMMESGLYRKPGLTVSGLAAEVSMPEHQARKLINEQLGYRNFTAFLNHYRIDEAKSRLADPASNRTQIAQIAYDAGFNSIGPFNRAFKLATGQTPTEYRRQELADFEQS